MGFNVCGNKGIFITISLWTIYFFNEIHIIDDYLKRGEGTVIKVRKRRRFHISQSDSRENDR